MRVLIYFSISDVGIEAC